MPEHGPTDDRGVKGNTAQRFSVPDPEVSSKRARRRLTVGYKLEILRKADACTQRGELGALLRREGLYSANVISWRRQREQGVLDPMRPRRRGRKPIPVNPLARKLAEVERENRRLQKRLEKADLIIDFQKKVHALLGIPLNHPDDVEND
jgi:transposase-like protein